MIQGPRCDVGFRESLLRLQGEPAMARPGLQESVLTKCSGLGDSPLSWAAFSTVGCSGV